MKYNIVKLFMLELISSSSGYNMVKVDPGFVSVAPGETTRLLCGTDGHWEYCKWYSPGGQDCDFEWKRMTNSVEKQACSLGDHVEFTGEYNDKECGIIINNVQDADAGLWICHIEEYVFLGGQGSGRNVEAKINVTVQAPTTVPPPTTSATTPTTTTVTTPLTTTATSAVTSTLSWNDDDIHSSVVHSDHTEDKNATTDVHTTSTTDVHATSATTDVHATSATTDVYKQDAADIDEESIIPGYSDTPSAVPRIEEVDSTIPAVVVEAGQQVAPTLISSQFINRAEKAWYVPLCWWDQSSPGFYWSGGAVVDLTPARPLSTTRPRAPFTTNEQW